MVDLDRPSNGSLPEGRQPVATYLGGVRFGGLNATWPLARLDLFDNRLLLRSSTRLLRAVVPTWDASFAEVTEVQAVGKIRWFTTGIRLRAGRQDNWIIFWTGRRKRVLRSIEELGISVNAVPMRFHFVNPGR
jgi:hypothetical protein